MASLVTSTPGAGNASPPLVGFLGGDRAWLVCFLGRAEPGARWSDGAGAFFLSEGGGRAHGEGERVPQAHQIKGKTAAHPWPIQLTGSSCRRRNGSARAEWHRPALEGGRCELTVDGKTRGGCGFGSLAHRGCAGGITAAVADSGDPGRFRWHRGEGLCGAGPVGPDASCPL